MCNMSQTGLIKGMTRSEYMKDWRRKNPAYGNARLRRLMESDPIRTAAALIFRNARSRARRRSIPFEIDASWLEKELGRGKCELTGLPFTFEIGSPFMPSLDRIASRHGYTATNSRVVIWFANQAKSNLDDDEFFDLLRLVVTGITTSRRRRPPGARLR